MQQSGRRPAPRQQTPTTGNFSTTTFGYNSKGRLSLIRYPLATGDTGDDTVRFTLYDDAGRLLSRGTTEYQFDPLGDAVLLLDGAGAVTARQVFDGWGNALMAATGPFGYRGRYGYFADSETGLVALAHRQYSVVAGSFLNRDPLRHRGGRHLYSYVRNRPSMLADPSGWGGVPAKVWITVAFVFAAGLLYGTCKSIFWAKDEVNNPPDRTTEEQKEALEDIMDPEVETPGTVTPPPAVSDDDFKDTVEAISPPDYIFPVDEIVGGPEDVPDYRDVRRNDLPER